MSYQQPRAFGWRRVGLSLTVALTALAAAAALFALTATQLTARPTAERYLADALTTLLEVDQLVQNNWALLVELSAAGEPIPLPGLPFSLLLQPAALADGPQAVAEAIAAASASLVYEDGLALLSESPQVFRLISQGGAFEATAGRLTAGGHEAATAALLVSGIIALLLAAAAAAQAGGLGKIGAPALGLGAGAALVWLAALLARGAFTNRAETVLDPFEADLWLIAADAVGLLIRNGGTVAAAAAVAALAVLAGGLLLRWSEAAGAASPSPFR